MANGLQLALLTTPRPSKYSPSQSAWKSKTAVGLDKHGCQTNTWTRKLPMKMGGVHIASQNLWLVNSDFGRGSKIGTPNETLVESWTKTCGPILGDLILTHTPIFMGSLRVLCRIRQGRLTSRMGASRWLGIMDG